MDTKILIATLSLAATMGFWNLFSTNAVQADKAALDPNVAPPPSGGQDLPPLPTLVPLVNVQGKANLPVSQVQPQPAGQAPVLRAVAAPSVTIVQKNAPVVDSVAASGGGGGGGRGGVTSTRSSRPRK